MNENETVTETETVVEIVEKPKRSLLSKVLIGVGVAAGMFIAGAVAASLKRSEDEEELAELPDGSTIDVFVIAESPIADTTPAE